LKAKNINFQINDSLPKNATVMADQTRITQVLLNLLSNAIKYTPDGGKIRLDVLAPTDSMHRFVVTDSGIGIPAKYHEEVFTPFNRMGVKPP
jgi:signal transduction histidine kinase